MTKPKVQVSKSDIEMMLQDPEAILLLMDYEDLRYTQYQAQCDHDLEELEKWPTNRFVELKELGRQIISEDLEIYDVNLRREFEL